MKLYPVLRHYMEEHGVTDSELAAIAGVNTITFYLKMRGIIQWNLTEVVKICGFFRCPNAEHLFVRKHFKSQ